MDINNIAFIISVWCLPLIISITFHEAAHGFIAYKLGDPTAKLLGRLTFNPLKHIHVVGTLIMPAALLLLSGGQAMFGFAKPVPFDARYFKNPKKDVGIVAFAGPASNILLAIISTLLLNFLFLFSGDFSIWLEYNLVNSIKINIILAIFNMIPILPADGGRVVNSMLPDSLSYKFQQTEKYGMMILIGLVFLLPYIGGLIGYNLNIISTILGISTSKIGQLLINLFVF